MKNLKYFMYCQFKKYDGKLVMKVNYVEYFELLNVTY